MSDGSRNPSEDSSASGALSAAAFGEVFEACRAYLLAVADRELDADLRAKGGASDIVQETFMEAHRDITQFHGTSDEELRAWLRRLLLNNVSNFRRRYQSSTECG